MSLELISAATHRRMWGDNHSKGGVGSPTEEALILACHFKAGTLPPFYAGAMSMQFPGERKVKEESTPAREVVALPSTHRSALALIANERQQSPARMDAIKEKARP